MQQTTKKTRVIIKETLPTHGDKEIILRTIHATKRWATKGNFSLKILKPITAGQKGLENGQGGIGKIPRKIQPLQLLNRRPNGLFTISRQTRTNQVRLNNFRTKLCSNESFSQLNGYLRLSNGTLVDEKKIIKR